MMPLLLCTMAQGAVLAGRICEANIPVLLGAGGSLQKAASTTLKEEKAKGTGERVRGKLQSEGHAPAEVRFVLWVWLMGAWNKMVKVNADVFTRAVCKYTNVEVLAF